MSTPRMPELHTANIPLSLQLLEQWVCWLYVDREGKWTKAPLNPHTMSGADTTNHATWGSYKQVVEIAQQLPDQIGIGFVFKQHGNLTGIDLDKCRNHNTGKIATWAAAIMMALRSYTEVSPSGTGVKIWISGALPDGTKSGSRRPIAKIPSLSRYGGSGGELEMYHHSRYFAVTGQRLDEINGCQLPADPECREKELLKLYHMCFQSSVPATAATAAAAPAQSQTESQLSDAEVLAKAPKAKQGQLFDCLWAGDWAGAGRASKSEGDYKLCAMLAFWCNKDAAQIDRLFRRSGLFVSCREYPATQCQELETHFV